MSVRLTHLLFAALLSVVFARAASPQAADASPQQRPGSLKVTGCVAPDAAEAGHFTLVDFTTGEPTYRLSGKDVRRFLGQRVEVSGTAPQPKLSIVGGLSPSPNVAAQAGAIDPAQAAMAAQGAQGNAKPGEILVPDFRVVTVKRASGGCPPKK